MPCDGVVTSPGQRRNIAPAAIPSKRVYPRVLIARVYQTPQAELDNILFIA
jgi:hypothetical protein